MLFTLFTHDCTPINTSNPIITFADDSTVVGLITDNEEMAYRLEVEHLVSKTKELIIDFRRTRKEVQLPSTYMEKQWRVWMISSSLESACRTI